MGNNDQALDVAAAADAARTTNEAFYVRSGDGKFYLEVPKPDGGFDYIEETSVPAFQELSNGKFIAVRDVEEMRRQQQGTSHLDYFHKLPGDTRDAKQRMKRQDKLEQQIAQLAIDRVSPGAHPNVKTITDNEFLAHQREYADASRQGRQRECDFQPLNSYVHKLVTKGGKIIRPVLAGEVGMIGSTILTLQQGYGTGNLVTVSDYTSKDRED